MAAQETERRNFQGPESTLEEGTGEEKRTGMDDGDQALPSITMRNGSPLAPYCEVPFSASFVMVQIFVGAMFVWLQGYLQPPWEK